MHVMDESEEFEELAERLYTRRQWLTRVAILHADPGAWIMAREAVSSLAIEHPEWDMDGERRTWAEWEGTA